MNVMFVLVPNIDEENIARSMNMEDDLMLQFDDSNPELGRDAPAGLDDHPYSAMPWNVSASVQSFRTQEPGSIRGRGSSVPSGHPGSRLISASPLLGRGSALGGPLTDIERIDEQADNFAPVGGYSSSLGAVGGRGRTLTPSGDHVTEEEFEMFWSCSCS